MKQLHRATTPTLASPKYPSISPAILRFLLEDGLMIFCLTMFLLAQAWPERARAEEHYTELGDVQTGSLLFLPQSATAPYVSATRLNTEALLSVSGIWLTGTLTQEFENTTDQWQEALYVFPLPEQAAVHAMRIEIGDRLIEGEIQEKAKARATYQQAKSEGKHAALTEQKRPNLFQTAVAHIPPHETVKVQLEYAQTLAYRNQQFELRLPTTLTPRYIPGVPVLPPQHPTLEAWQKSANQQGSLSSGWSLNTDQVPDAAEITPFTLPKEALPEDSHHFRLTLTLDPGMPITGIRSTTHRILVSTIASDQQKPETYRVQLQERIEAMDRDLVITWTPTPGQEPESALFSEYDGEYTYGLVMLMPPQASAPRPAPKELILVIDTSGSMGGTSIEQAKSALLFALSSLNDQDRFNIIQFNSTASALFAQSQPATSRNRKVAEYSIASLQADGGTEMAQALTLALPVTGNAEEEQTWMRQVVFITDGSVGNEEALFSLIQQRLGSSRLFPVGIGSAPNSHFMAKAAEYGRGTYEYISSLEEVAVKMQSLFEKIRYPALKDISLSLENTEEFEAYPSIIQDLYQSEPVLFSFRFRGETASGQITGQTWDEATELQTWQRTLHLSPQPASQRKTLSRIWARQKLDTLLRQPLSAGMTPLRQQATQLALDFHLLSPYTSLVAVDKTPVRSIEEARKLQTSSVPTRLPRGSDSQQARYPQTATVAPLFQWIGGMGTLLALLGLRLSRKGEVTGRGQA